MIAFHANEAISSLEPALVSGLIRLKLGTLGSIAKDVIIWNEIAQEGEDIIVPLEGDGGSDRWGYTRNREGDAVSRRWCMPGGAFCLGALL